MPTLTPVTPMPVTPEIPVATMTPKGSWGPALTRAERSRRNHKLHEAFGKKGYTRLEWRIAQVRVHDGTHGYRAAVKVARELVSA